MNASNCFYVFQNLLAIGKIKQGDQAEENNCLKNM